MTRKDAALALAKKTGLTVQQAEGAIIDFLDIVRDEMKVKRHVYIRGFGTFEMKLRKAKIARNIRTGESIPIPERLKPHVKFSKKF